MIQTTIEMRLKSPINNGSIHDHFKENHNQKPSIDKLIENTTVLAKAENRYQLAIKEALLISYHAPSINRQFGNFANILKLHAHIKPNLANSVSLSKSKLVPHPRQTDISSFSSNFNCIRNFSNNELSSDTENIPDMKIILEKFGIDPDKLSEIPLKSYNPVTLDSRNPFSCNFDDIILLDKENSSDLVTEMQDTLSISQRIKTLVRRARTNIN